MFINSQKIINLLEQLAPKRYAEDWDNVGFLIGSDQLEIQKVMVTLDVTEAVVDEAIEKNVDLIVSHHPMIFKGLKSITDRSYKGRLIRKLIKADIHVYAAHTNLDITAGGLNDYLAGLLELEQVDVLDVSGSDAYYKLVTMVPTDSVPVVEEALFKAGAGRLGNYEQCDFKVTGQGSFKPLTGANPAIGNVGVREFVEEVRLEMIVLGEVLDQCTRALLKSHPYETPAYDIFKMENLEKAYGLGRVGRFTQGLSGEAFIERLKSVLGSNYMRVAGILPEKIYKVGLCTGAGSEFIHTAKRKGCDVFITGDVKYHEAQLAEELDMCVIDAGHYETEGIYVDYLRDYLTEKCTSKNYEVRIIKSEFLENPFKVY
ncbi:MAG: Nif3-like dinuclear metal center hexameric protein [Clostridia bacterium]|nr:Nif3-like dinuclear metal center hexameric protein [Clostridia bacterium]